MDAIIAAPTSHEVVSWDSFFFHAERQSAAKIHRRLCSVCGDNVMSDSCVREWCRKFRDGRTDVMTTRFFLPTNRRLILEMPSHIISYIISYHIYHIVYQLQWWAIIFPIIIYHSYIHIPSVSLLRHVFDVISQKRRRINALSFYHKSFRC
jgi:hypothetical protein